MSSYATVYLADGREVCSFRDGVDQLFLILFTERDRVELHGEEALALTRTQYPDQNIDEAVVVGFRTTAGVLRDRLDVMGVDERTVAAELDRLVAEELARVTQDLPYASASQLQEMYADRAAALRGLNWGTWVRQLRDGLGAGASVTRSEAFRSVGSPSWLMDVWEYHDPRYRLRALLEALSGDEVITLDLAELMDGGWIDSSVDPQSFAKDFVAYASLGGLPPIVLTEGRFDVEVLSAGLAIRRPHLAGFIRLPDFATRPEGGAAALRQTVRAFASAGIPNRVVALFDNDTAARDVVRTIDMGSLPTNISVEHLPELQLGKRYPTDGPQGRHEMDVNGLAASIELFLGSDVLIKHGSLRPVEWRGYVAGANAYQGELAGKGEVQEAFRHKVGVAAGSPHMVESQDWSGIDLILDHVIASLRRLG